MTDYLTPSQFTTGGAEAAAWERADHWDWLREQAAAVRAQYDCPECGSQDGMAAIHHDTIEELLIAGTPLPSPLYNAGTANYLYHHCPFCNDCPDQAPPEYCSLTEAEVYDWLWPAECNCVLPEQSCLICWAAAREVDNGELIF